MSTPPRMSLILPCFNGGSYIRASLATLDAWLAGRDGGSAGTEVIVVDDGSADDTAAAAQAAGVPFRLIRHPHNRGKGAAVRTGMLAATGDYRIFIDADLPYELAIIDRMLHYLDFKEFDVCIGSRVTRGSSHSIERPALRKVASRVFSEFVGRLVVTGVGDTQCGVKGFRGDVARYLFESTCVENLAFDVEILYLAFKNGLDVKSLPVRLVADAPSTVTMVRHGLPMLVEVAKLPIRFHRGGYPLYAGRERP
jgi:dolichyl-phosphate beta-glucosyltransferase